LLRLGSRKKAPMAIDITALLLVDKNVKRSTLPEQHLDYILKLDEGHDRPVWVWVHNSDRDGESGNLSPLVPEAPETILEDGLLLLIAEGLGDEGLRAALNGRRSPQNRLYDLNLPDGGNFANLRKGIAEAIAPLTVRLVRLPGCSIKAEEAEAFWIEVASFS
jgi:hypothetical protein